MDWGYLLFAVGELGRDGLVGGEGTKQGIEAVEAVFREAALLDLVSCGFAELRLTDGHGEVGSEQGGERGADESRRRDRSLWAGISTLAILGQLWQTAHEGLGVRSREQQQQDGLHFMSARKPTELYHYGRCMYSTICSKSDKSRKLT